MLHPVVVTLGDSLQTLKFSKLLLFYDLVDLVFVSVIMKDVTNSDNTDMHSRKGRRSSRLPHPQPSPKIGTFETLPGIVVEFFICLVFCLPPLPLSPVRIFTFVKMDFFYSYFSVTVLSVANCRLLWSSFEVGMYR